MKGPRICFYIVNKNPRGKGKSCCCIEWERIGQFKKIYLGEYGAAIKRYSTIGSTIPPTNLVVQVVQQRPMMCPFVAVIDVIGK